MTSDYTKFTLQEMMAVAAAREIKDGEKVIIGTGLPLLGAFLAQKTHAPNMVAIYESGAIDCKPIVTPFSVADSVLVPGSAMQGGLMEGLGIVHAGELDLGFLGGAQIDKYGNINATVIGNDYAHPKTRLPGSGGSQEIAAWANRCYLMTPHQKRRFPEKVDFMTSAGFLNGRKSREATGVRGGGMLAVVTDIGLMEPDESGELILTALHPGRTADEARANTGWELKCAPVLKTTEPVTEKELGILREELDPRGIYLKGG